MLNRLGFASSDPGDALFIRLKASISFIALGVDIQISVICCCCCWLLMLYDDGKRICMGIVVDSASI